MDHVEKPVAENEAGGYRREVCDKSAVGPQRKWKMQEKVRVRILPDLAFFGSDSNGRRYLERLIYYIYGVVN